MHLLGEHSQSTGIRNGCVMPPLIGSNIGQLTTQRPDEQNPKPYEIGETTSLPGSQFQKIPLCKNQNREEGVRWKQHHKDMPGCGISNIGNLVAGGAQSSASFAVAPHHSISKVGWNGDPQQMCVMQQHYYQQNMGCIPHPQSMVHPSLPHFAPQMVPSQIVSSGGSNFTNPKFQTSPSMNQGLPSISASAYLGKNENPNLAVLELLQKHAAQQGVIEDLQRKLYTLIKNSGQGGIQENGHNKLLGEKALDLQGTDQISRNSHIQKMESDKKSKLERSRSPKSNGIKVKNEVKEKAQKHQESADDTNSPGIVSAKEWLPNEQKNEVREKPQEQQGRTGDIKPSDELSSNKWHSHEVKYEVKEEKQKQQQNNSDIISLDKMSSNEWHSHDVKKEVKDKKQKQQESTGDMESSEIISRKEWHSINDIVFRRSMIISIVKVIEQLRPDARKMADKLPILAKKLEEHLYRSAPTREDYIKVSTLKKRLFEIANMDESMNSKKGKAIKVKPALNTSEKSVSLVERLARNPGAKRKPTKHSRNRCKVVTEGNVSHRALPSKIVKSANKTVAPQQEQESRPQQPQTKNSGDMDIQRKLHTQEIEKLRIREQGLIQQHLLLKLQLEQNRLRDYKNYKFLQEQKLLPKVTYTDHMHDQQTKFLHLQRQYQLQENIAKLESQCQSSTINPSPNPSMGSFVQKPQHLIHSFQQQALQPPDFRQSLPVELDKPTQKKDEVHSGKGIRKWGTHLIQTNQDSKNIANQTPNTQKKSRRESVTFLETKPPAKTEKISSPMPNQIMPNQISFNPKNSSSNPSKNQSSSNLPFFSTSQTPA